MHQQWKNLLHEILRTFCRCVDAVSLSWWLICWMQCALPIFEGLLLEPYGTIVMDLLFELATWHGLAKMCLHTESTIQSLWHSRTRLGMLLRQFQSVTCEAYITWELPSEEAACGHWKAAEAAKWSTAGKTGVEELMDTVKKNPRWINENSILQHTKLTHLRTTLRDPTLLDLFVAKASDYMCTKLMIIHADECSCKCSTSRGYQ